MCSKYTSEEKSLKSTIVNSGVSQEVRVDSLGLNIDNAVVGKEVIVSSLL